MKLYLCLWLHNETQSMLRAHARHTYHPCPPPFWCALDSSSSSSSMCEPVKCPLNLWSHYIIPRLANSLGCDKLPSRATSVTLRRTPYAPLSACPTTPSTPPFTLAPLHPCPRTPCPPYPFPPFHAVVPYPIDMVVPVSRTSPRVLPVSDAPRSSESLHAAPRRTHTTACPRRLPPARI